MAVLIDLTSLKALPGTIIRIIKKKQNLLNVRRIVPLLPKSHTQ